MRSFEHSARNVMVARAEGEAFQALLATGVRTGGEKNAGLRQHAIVPATPHSTRSVSSATTRAAQAGSAALGPPSTLSTCPGGWRRGAVSPSSSGSRSRKSKHLATNCNERCLTL